MGGEKNERSLRATEETVAFLYSPNQSLNQHIDMYLTFGEPVQLIERVQMRAKGQHPVRKDLCPRQGGQLGFYFECHQAKSPRSQPPETERLV